MIEGVYYNRYSILICSILCVGVFFVWYFLRIPALCSVRRVECVIDSFLAPSEHENIKSYFLSHTFHDMQTSIASVRNSFAWVEAIKMSIFPLRSIVRICAYKPYVCIGDRDAITVEGLLLEQKWYQSSVLQRCVKIGGKVFDDTLALAHFLHSVPQEAYIFYSIDWFDEYTIIMHDRKAPIDIIATLDYPPSLRILEYCLVLKNMLASSHQLTKGWTIDTRFPGMLVLARRGRNHGASLS